MAAAAACGKGDRADDRKLLLDVPPAPAGVHYLRIEELRLTPQAWLVDVGPAAPVPDLVAHAPLFVGPLVVVAGSRVGYIALDRKTGAIAWRRPAGPSLGNPVLDGRELVLVHDCEGEVAAAADQVALACVDRIEPRDVAARRASVIHAAAADLDACAPSGAWAVTLSAGALALARGGCAWTVDAAGLATRVAVAPAPEPADDVVFPGWRRETHGAEAYVYGFAPRLPGLTVLAAAGGDVVVRADRSLRKDYVALDHRAWWPLPPPADARSTPVAIGRSDHLVVVFFDGSRVAALTAP